MTSFNDAFKDVYCDSETGKIQFHMALDGQTVDLGHLSSVVDERIARQQKPAQTFIKQLERIELHWQQLQDAVTKLLDSYSNTQVPQKRTSAAHAARLAMLKGMSDKVLKMFASEYLDTGDYILPDDRDNLVSAVLTAMKDAEKAEVA